MVESESIIGKFIVQVIDDFQYLYKTYIQKEDVHKEHEYAPQTPTRQPFDEQWHTYWCTAGYRTIIKDIWFFTSILGFFFFMWWTMAHIDSITQPTVRKPYNGDYITYTGNCDWMWSEYKKYQAVDNGEGIMDNKDWVNFSVKDIKQELVVNVNSSEFQTQDINPTTTTTIKVKCPECQTCIYPKPCQLNIVNETKPNNNLSLQEWLNIIPAEAKHTMLNMRMKKPGNSDCVQYGYNIGKADYLTYLGLKNTYNDQTIYDIRIGWNTINTTVTNDMFCFQKQNGSAYGLNKKYIGFTIDLSLWNMNHTLENTTTWNMTTYEYHSYTNHSNYSNWETYNMSTVVLNESENWFIWK